MGYTHIELLPVSEHPLSASWGYQTVGYYAATSRYGTPQDFMYFVDHLPPERHRRDPRLGAGPFPPRRPRPAACSTARASTSTPIRGRASIRDWGTLIFNYGRHEVRNFLISNALFWLDKYHIDGLRVDAVASMLYLDYSREDGRLAAQRVRRAREPRGHRVPQGIQRAGPLPASRRADDRRGIDRLAGRLAADLPGRPGLQPEVEHGLDERHLRYMRHEPIHRKYHHDELTFSLIYAFHENFVLPLSHDEVVHGKGSLLDQMPGDLWQKFANLRLLYSYMWTHPGKKLLFMGGDFGQWNEWNYDTSLQWDLLQWESHQGLQKCVADLNRLYRRENGPARGRFRLPRLRVDRLPQLRRQHAELHPPGQGPAATSWSSPATSRPCRARCIAWACPSCAGTKRSSTATRRTTAAATWATVRANGRTTALGRPPVLDPHHAAAAGRRDAQAAQIARRAPP